jgi:hypothetical protein
MAKRTARYIAAAGAHVFERGGIMSAGRTICFSAIAVGILGLSACDQAPAGPTTIASKATASPAAVDARFSSAPAGFYTLTFLHYGQEVTTLPAGPYEVSHVLVKAHVEDLNHQPAQSGSVLFEVCRYRATGKSAPSSACADGTARWKRLIVSGEVNPATGDAIVGRDVVSVPCIMGWRATYRGSQTIAPGTMGPVDFTWYAQ